MNARFLLLSTLLVAGTPGLAIAQSICDVREPTPPAVETGLEGQGKKYGGQAFFFSGEHFVAWNWNKRRVIDGSLLPLNAWKLSPHQRKVDAAAIGEGDAYRSTGYLFDGSNYQRYLWSNETLDATLQPNTLWKLPATRTIDAALPGYGKWAGRTYFFFGNKYATYEWTTATSGDKLTDGLSLAAWGLTGVFANGIDAAVNGGGLNTGWAYFFRGSQWVGYDWTEGKLGGPPGNIADDWRGLAEMLAVGRAQTRARAWIRPALAWLRADLKLAEAGASSIGRNETDALAKHFHLGGDHEQRKLHLPKIIAMFEAVERTLTNGGAPYKFATLTEAAAENNGGTPPAYTIAFSYMKFTPTFLRQGPKGQAAMVLHEAVHFNDASTTPVDIYEHSPLYAGLSPADAAHNPSSFAMFAQQVYCGADRRYGAVGDTASKNALINRPLRSINERYELVMQPDGDLVLFANGSASSRRILWQSQTAGNPGARAVMQSDGNLVVSAGPLALWSSGTHGNPDARLVMQDDGNLVIYRNGTTTPLWSTNTPQP